MRNALSSTHPASCKHAIKKRYKRLSSRSDHAECAAAAIALVAMGDAGSSPVVPASGQSSSFSTAGAGREGFKVPTEAGWPVRMLTAGGWQSLIRCLSVLPESTAMHQVVAIGLKYLSREVMMSGR